jgi:lycopene cyclase domain-containing protein
LEGPSLSFIYLAALVGSLAGLVALDVRFQLALYKDLKRGLTVLTVSTLFFLGWDILGIGLGIFSRGSAKHLTGILLAPELPLEEIFFLILLSYTTLIVFTAIEKARQLKQ